VLAAHISDLGFPHPASGVETMDLAPFVFPAIVSAASFVFLVGRIRRHLALPPPTSERELRLYRAGRLELRGILILVVGGVFFVIGFIPDTLWLEYVGGVVGAAGLLMIVIGSYRRANVEMGG